MDWYKFENLIRQLFEAMGMEVKVTQSSRDEGIDAVAYNKTDIVHRAEILIQAKRYSNCVPANDVRALAGSVDEKRATAGILVTTAWVSPETKAFAARNNRLRVIEGGELKHLLAEHLSLDVRIALTTSPASQARCLIWPKQACIRDVSEVAPPGGAAQGPATLPGSGIR